MTLVRRMARFLPLGLALLLSSVVLLRQGSVSPSGLAVVGGQAPSFSLPTLQGGTLTLPRGRPVIVNFFASWCPPCRAEWPQIRKAAPLLARQGIAILAIDDTPSEHGLSAVQRMAFPPARGLTILLDPTGMVYQQYLVRDLPTTVFIGSDGVIRRIAPGPETLSEILSRARHLKTP